MRYEIVVKDNNTVEVFDTENPNENNAPFLRQDKHPDGHSWFNQEEARAWVENFVASLSAPFVEEESPIEE
jgi:hypothetical protein